MMKKPYQLQYQEILNDQTLPSLNQTLNAQYLNANGVQQQLFPIADIYPQFFNQNLVSDERIIKHVKGPHYHALFKTFYYQLFRLCFQMEAQKQNYLQVMKQIIFNKELFYQSRSFVSKNSNNSSSRVSKKSDPSSKQRQSQDKKTRTYKKYLGQFIQKLSQSEGQIHFQQLVNKYKIIDHVMIQFIEIIVQNCQEQIKNIQDIFQCLCQVFAINLIPFQNCFKFQQSDVFIYIQQRNDSQFQIFIAFSQQQEQESEVTEQSLHSFVSSNKNSSKKLQQGSNEHLKSQNQNRSQIYARPNIQISNNKFQQNQSSLDQVITSNIKQQKQIDSSDKKPEYYAQKNIIGNWEQKLQKMQWGESLQEVKTKIVYDANNRSISSLPANTNTNFAANPNAFHKKQGNIIIPEQNDQIKQRNESFEKKQQHNQYSPRMSQSNADTIMNMLGDTIKSNNNIQSSISSVTNLKKLNASQVMAYNQINYFGSQSNHKFGQRKFEQNPFKSFVNEQLKFDGELNEKTDHVPEIKMKKQIKSDTDIKQAYDPHSRLKSLTIKKETIEKHSQNKNSNYEHNSIPQLSMQKQNSQVINQWIKQNLQQSGSKKQQNLQQQYLANQVATKQSRGSSHHSYNSAKSKQPNIKINSVKSQDSQGLEDFDNRNNYYTQEDKKSLENKHVSQHIYSIQNSSLSRKIKPTLIYDTPKQQKFMDNFNSGQCQTYKTKYSYAEQDDQMFFNPKKNSKFGLNTITEVTSSKQTNRQSYKLQNNQNHNYQFNQNKIKISQANSVFYGQNSQKQKRYIRNQIKHKQQNQDQSKGTFYRQFSDSKILKLLKQPHKTKVQILKNRFKGQHRLDILKI